MKKVLLVFCLLVFSGCDDVVDGVITHKEHIPAYTSMIFALVGKVMVPMPIHNKEEWRVRVSGSNKEGKNISKTYSIERKCFDSVKIGDKWPIERRPTDAKK